MKALGVSFTDLAKTVRLSRSSLHALANLGAWPVRQDREILAQRIRTTLTQRGADEGELADLFEPVRPVERREGNSNTGRSRPPRAARRVAPAEPSEIDVLIHKQMLSPQALRHFKLFRNPFDGPVERDDQLFVNDEFAFVREVCWQCAQNAGFTAVIGESGAGKTTVLDDLQDRLSKNSRGVVLIKPSIVGMEERTTAGSVLRSSDLLHAVITALDATTAIPLGLQARTVLAVRMLTASARAGSAHLLAVEEAHCMPDAALKHLKRLHELREGRRPLLGILLLGQPELQRRLDVGLRNGTLREVAQRCEIFTMSPLGADLRDYLACRTTAYGRELDSILEADAVATLAEKLTAKVGRTLVPMSFPLAANNMVTRAMNLAANIGSPLVTPDVIKAA